MNTRIAAAVLAASVALALPLAAQEAPARPEHPRTSFRLDYQIYELEGGKRVNERSYTQLVNEGGSGNLRVGSRVPIPAGEKGVQYMDVGLRINSRISEKEPGDVVLDADVDVSSFAIPEQADLKTSPVVRTLSQSVSTHPPLGRPTILSSVDDVNSKKRTAGRGDRHPGEVNFRGFSAPRELGEREGEEALLLRRELGEDRERERLCGGLLRLREVPDLASEVREALLKVERDRVVDRVADLSLGEAILQRVAAPLPHPDDELVEDVETAGRLAREGEPPFVVRPAAEIEVKALDLLRVAPATFGPAVEVRELHVEDRGLEGVEAEVAADERW